MRLLIISHTPHYRRGADVVGWGPTLREIDQLASMFDEVRHIAPLHSGPAPASALPYARHNVRLIPVRPAGGETAGSKLRVLAAYPGYLRHIVRELPRCDVVHVRCPASIGLLAVLLLLLSRRPKRRWIKYAGNWSPSGGEWRSYRLQRWLLARGGHGAVVTVNGAWVGQPPHVRSFFNPCLTREELAEGRRAAVSKRLDSPMRLLFVGRLDAAKGCGRALAVLARLGARGVAAVLDVVGEGPDREAFEREARAAGLESRVRFLGGLPRGDLAGLYARAHFLLLPSTSSEGWPKVLSEGMAYGVVAIASDVSSIPQYLDRFGSGRALAADDLDGFAKALSDYAADPSRWKAESESGIEVAKQFSYESYLSAVREILEWEAV